MAGKWENDAGTDGTVAIPSGAKVVQFSARGPEGSTIQVGSFPAISAYPSFAEQSQGYIQGPVNIVFTGTDAFVVTWVNP